MVCVGLCWSVSGQHSTRNFLYAPHSLVEVCVFEVEVCVFEKESLRQRVVAGGLVFAERRDRQREPTADVRQAAEGDDRAQRTDAGEAHHVQRA